jgi:hypothetical protein
VLEAQPDSECASEGLEGLKGAPDFWDWLEEATKDVGLALGFFALGLGVIGLGLLIVLQPITRCRWTKNGRFAHIFVRPSIKVIQPDASWMSKNLSAQFASILRENIANTSRGGARLASGAAGINQALQPLSELKDAGGAASLIAFLTALLPRREFEVSGSLRPGTRTAPGISLELTNVKHGTVAKTLWGDEFRLGADGPDIEAIEILAIAAAAWVELQLANSLDVGGALLTQDDLAWMLFKVGSYRLGKGDDSKAAPLVRDAVVKDSGNGGAVANLGLIELHKGNHNQARYFMEQACMKLAEADSRKGSLKSMLNPDLHRVRHNLAVVNAQQAATLGGASKEGAKRLSKANEEARGLVVDELRLLARMPKDAPSFLRPRLEKALLPSTLAVYVSTANKVSAGPRSNAEEDDLARLLGRLERKEPCADEALRYLERFPDPGTMLRYNIACAQAAQGYIPAATCSLTVAIGRNPPSLRAALATGALKDPTLKGLIAADRDLERKLRRWGTEHSPCDR